MKTTHWLCGFLLRLLGGMLLLAIYSTAQATVADGKIRIGVLSFRSQEQTQKQWQPTLDHLNRTIPDYRFSMVPLNLDKVEQALKQGAIEYLFTNPEQYISLRERYGLAALLTFVNLADGKPVSRFGGVIFTTADRDDIRSLADIKGKSISAVSDRSFAAYLIQRWELHEHHIDISSPAEMQFIGLPQDNIVNAVLHKKADIGFVRTGVLEAMISEKKLKRADIKILNEKKLLDFPLLLSTDLYPEWPLAATPNLPDVLTKTMVQRLFEIKPSDPAALTGQYFGFMPPGDYSSVEAVMVKLRALRNFNSEFDWRDIYKKYITHIIIGVSLLLLSILATIIYLWRKNRYLRQAYSERDQLSLRLSMANTTLENKVAQRTRQFKDAQNSLQLLLDSMSEGMYGVDLNGNCTFVNSAFLKILGYDSEDELIGAHIHTLIHHSHADGTPYPARECKMFKAFRANKATHADDEVFWRKDGTPIAVEYWAHPTVNDGVVVGAVATFQEITERKNAEQQIQQLAFYDALTGLPNRRLLIDRVNQALSISDRNGNYGAVLFMDLDHFKTLNDTRGHDYGDLLLIEVGKRLESCLRDGDTVARLGGDEFVVVLSTLSKQNTEAASQAEMVAEKIHTRLNDPYQLKEYTHVTTPSIGIVLFKGHANTLDDLLKFADIAMYQAKSAGRNSIRFYDPDMQTVIEQRAKMEVDLRNALKDNQFCLYFQIQVDHQQRPLGAEVLIRWPHPTQGLIPPHHFIPLAEETQLIVPIGLWVIRTACEQLKIWESDVKMAPLSLAVNVTGLQFSQPDFVAQVKQLLLETGANPNKLKLEITESMMLKNMEEVIHKMVELKLIGVSFSLDDFGTGYSSLQYLKRLPLDQIKIDQSFVRDIGTDPNDDAIVKTVIAMAKSLDFEVIAEGVETEEQRSFLEHAGCLSFQGYLFSRPIPLDQFEALLHR